MTKKISPKAPRKQRKQIYKSPLHANKRRLKCRLDEFLHEEYGLRSLVIKKGDLVRVMRGQFRDTEGKVIGVSYSKMKIYIESATTTKADGKEVNIPLHPSNLLIVKLEIDDERKSLIEKKVMEIAESE
ncbi:MAG: 50S ribosomal protein L24 [Candidatus Thorarchaeota archaeon]